MAEKPPAVPGYNELTVPPEQTFKDLADFVDDLNTVLDKMVADLKDAKYEPGLGDFSEATDLVKAYRTERDTFVKNIQGVHGQFDALRKATLKIGQNYKSLADADSAKADEITKALTENKALIPKDAGKTPVW